MGGTQIRTGLVAARKPIDVGRLQIDRVLARTAVSSRSPKAAVLKFPTCIQIGYS
jgi:hypothetical protein